MLTRRPGCAAPAPERSGWGSTRLFLYLQITASLRSSQRQIYVIASLSCPCVFLQGLRLCPRSRVWRSASGRRSASITCPACSHAGLNLTSQTFTHANLRSRRSPECDCLRPFREASLWDHARQLTVRSPTDEMKRQIIVPLRSTAGQLAQHLPLSEANGIPSGFCFVVGSTPCV